MRSEGQGVPGSRGAVQVTPKGCTTVELGAGSSRLASPCGCWLGEEQWSGPPLPSPLHRQASTRERCLQVPAELGQQQLLHRGVAQVQGHS